MRCTRRGFRKTAELLELARHLADTDFLQSLAVGARDHDFTRPNLTEKPTLSIEEGRHPVVEALCEPGTYVPNDLELDANSRQILLVTGPNMAGKSTYLRQVALVTLLSQMGSFVPARRAEIGLVDRIFTRVGAADRLAMGQSTFMVEMIETANILHNASDRSLVLLDEIGRGTSTYDGLSLAWAIVEALHDNSSIAARTLFATHYHELTVLQGRLERLENVQVAVRESEGQVIFLRKILEGACDSSYGVQVARMAGIPEGIIKRAWEILGGLDKGHLPDEPASKTGLTAPKDDKSPQSQQDLFSTGPTTVFVDNPLQKGLYEEVMKLDINNLTPLDLMMRVQAYQAKYAKADKPK